MFSQVRRNPVAYLLSLVIHVLLIYLLVRATTAVLTTDSAAPITSESVESIPVEIPDESVQQALEQLREEREKQQQEVIGLKQQEDEQLRKIREQNEREQQRLAEMKKQREAEQKRLAQELAEKERRIAELKEKEAAERKKAEEAAKLAEQKREAERKAAEAKAKAEAARKKKAEEEAARVAAEQRQREAREKQAAAANQKRGGTGSGSDTSRTAGGGGGKTYNKHIGMIRSKIQRNWRRPLGSTDEQNVKLRLTLFPGGGIADVQVAQTSGDPVFDRSAEDAVRRSDPLPVPSGKDFDQFRSFVLKFTPGRIR